MTVKKFAETVLQLVGLNQADFHVDARVVMAVAEIVILNILTKYTESGKEIPASLYRTYKFPVQYDSDMQRNYIQFVPPVMNIGNNEGLAFIGATLDEYDINSSYILLRAGQISSMATLEAQHFGGRPAARPEGNKAWLYNEPQGVTELLAQMIPQPSEMKETDEMFGLNLGLSGMEPDYVLRQTVNYILTKRGFKEDKLTDGASN